MENLSVTAEKVAAKDAWRRYDLNNGIENFIAAMTKGDNPKYLTAEMKQKITNLGFGAHFEGFGQTKHEYTSDLAPYFAAYDGNFTDEMKTAVAEYSLVNRISRSDGIKTRERYSMTNRELHDVLDFFRAADRGEFKKPSWIPDYCDDIDKAKAFVFAFLEDINYSGEYKILDHSTDMWAKYIALLDAGKCDAAHVSALLKECGFDIKQ